MRYIIAIVALASVAACETTPQGSETGVGFGSLEQYQKERAQRKAQLPGAALPAPNAVSGEALAPVQPAGQPTIVAQPQVQPQAGTDLAAATQTALNSTSDAATPDNPGISDENDFDAVGERRTIESDKERIARNKGQYKVIAVQPLPKRSGNIGSNIVEYALRSKNPVGTQVYSRANLTKPDRFQRNCAKYPSPDRAQSEFMAKGGPQRDKLGLDPDGDGYACAWDPTPFRKAVGG